MDTEHVDPQMKSQLDTRPLDDGPGTGGGENLEEGGVEDADEDAEVEGEGDHGVHEENDLQLRVCTCPPGRQLPRGSDGTCTLVARLPTGLSKASPPSENTTRVTRQIRNVVRNEAGM